MSILLSTKATQTVLFYLRYLMSHQYIYTHPKKRDGLHTDPKEYY